jgi:hypothetical protein
MSKYGNRKTEMAGILFDSKAEAERYGELLLMVAVGEISDLVLQPEYELQPKFKRDGKTIRAITYRADFRYREGDRVIVEDVKGMKTQQFELRKKMFLYKFPDVELRIVAA